MSVRLTGNAYGKSAIHVVKRAREGDRHAIIDLVVAVRLEGRYDRVYTDGDNANVLPTDTMKNTVFALAKEREWTHPEQFGRILADHFAAAAPDVERIIIELRQRPWQPLTIGGMEHGTAFQRADFERTARVERSVGEAAATTRGGVDGLMLLKSAGSAFDGYLRDRYTTLKETRDRILATSLTAEWRYAAGAGDGSSWEDVRDVLLEVFATHRSESVQHTLWLMGEAAVERMQTIDEIRLAMPNRHHLLVDLSPFGLTNENEVFVATSEPYGLIEATVARKQP